MCKSTIPFNLACKLKAHPKCTTIAVQETLQPDVAHNTLLSFAAPEQKEEREGALHSSSGQAAGGGEEAAGARAESPAPPQTGEGQLVTRQ